ncbi:MAG: ABC transporter permease [Planctomycetota bacterium]
MIKKFLSSRGAKKFRKNRSAMLSLGIIAAYTVLALWIAVSNSLNWIGEQTGAFSLSGNPLTRLFLTEGTTRVVGPKEIPGFGIAPDTQGRLASVDEMIGLARRGLEAVGQIDAESGRTVAQALSDVSWPDRPFADVPVEELRQRLGELESAFADVVSVRRGVQQLESLPVYAERVRDRRAELSALLDSGADDEDALLIAQEELAFGLEEFAEAAIDYADAAGPEDPIAQANPQSLMDASEALLDAIDPEEVRGAIPGDEAISAILDARGAAAERADAAVAGLLDELEPMLVAVFPEPTGLAGAVYAFKLMAGTDTQGRSIMVRALYSSYVAIQVGFVTALFAVIFGGLFGAAAAFIGGPLDHVFNWVYSMITSIPYLVLLAVLSFLFLGSAVEGTLVPLYVAFGVTYWVGPGRVIRGEAMKIKELEYVQATTAMGFGRVYILLKHVIPNTSHLLFINFSLLFIAAIKGEVILTFLGLGLKDGASWGIMIDQSKSQVVNDFFWQIGTATFFMFLLVLAFNIFTDALQDAFDPKHVS